MLSISIDRKKKGKKYVLDIGHSGVCKSQSYFIMLIKEYYDKNCEIEYAEVVFKF